MRLARVAGEIGQERLSLFKPDRHGVAGSSLEVEAVEQTQLQSRHHAENTSLFSARSRQGTHPGTPGATPWERPRRTRVACEQTDRGQQLPTNGGDAWIPTQNVRCAIVTTTISGGAGSSSGWPSGGTCWAWAGSWVPGSSGFDSITAGMPSSHATTAYSAPAMRRG